MSMVALITGSGRKRVGNVIAQYLAERGWNIALHFKSSEEEAKESVKQIRATGVKCDAFQADVTSHQEVQRLVEQTKDTFGTIDALVTTASIWSEGSLDEIGPDDLRSNFEVNTLGTFYAVQSAGRVMVDQKTGGSIVTIGDWAIERPYLDHAAYFLSKGSIPTLTRVMALELGHRNPKVRVNCIHPGPVMFPPDTSDDEAKELRDSTLVKDGDCPETVAQAVEMFIDNKFVTGTCLPVDGGRHMFTPSDAKR
ncbi:MAG: SDR family oxidoreductase [Fuerstiella sp.]